MKTKNIASPSTGNSHATTTPIPAEIKVINLSFHPEFTSVHTSHPVQITPMMPHI